MLAALRWAKLRLAFALELCALVALGWWGFAVGRVTAGRIGLAVGVPLLAAAVWGRFVAPRAPCPAAPPYRALIQLAFFGSAVVALVALGHARLVLALAVVVALNFALAALPER